MLNEVLNGLVAAVLVITFFLLGVWAAWDHERGKRKELEAKVARLCQTVENFICDDRPNSHIETVVWRVENGKGGAKGDWERIAAMVRALLPLNPSDTLVNTWLDYQGRVERVLVDDAHGVVARICQQLEDFSVIVRGGILDDAVTGDLDAITNFSKLIQQACKTLAPVSENEEVR